MWKIALLGAASFVPLLGIVLLMVGGGIVIGLLGPWLLVVPVVGVVATFVSLFVVYRNKSLGWGGLAWVAALGLFWFLLLPVFWHQKIYRPWANAI